MTNNLNNLSKEIRALTIELKSASLLNSESIKLQIEVVKAQHKHAVRMLNRKG